MFLVSGLSIYSSSRLARQQEQVHSSWLACQAVTLRDWRATGTSVSECVRLRHAAPPPHTRARRDRRRELRRSPPAHQQTVTLPYYSLHNSLLRFTLIDKEENTEIINIFRKINLRYRVIQRWN